MTFRPIHRTLALGLDDQPGFQRLYFVFNVSRTPVSVRSQLDPTALVQRDAGQLLTGEITPLPTHPNVLAFEIHDLPKARMALQGLEVYSIGEPPELVSIVLDGPAGAWIAKALTTPCLDTLMLDLKPVTGSVASAVPGPAAYKLELEKALKAVTPPSKRKASSFFAELDLATLEVLEPVPKMLDAVKVVTPLVQKRLGVRLAEHLADPGAYTRFELEDPEKVYLERIAKLFVELAKTHFAPTASKGKASLKKKSSKHHPAAVSAFAAAGIDPDRFEEAFEEFADGRLRLKLQPSGMWSTQPSSGFYFYFAELALLAAEAQLAAPLGPALWTALANVMIRTQESFAARYGPEKQLGHDRDTADYGACQYRLETELDKPSDVRRADLRVTFAPKRRLGALAVACAENAKNLLRREAIGP